MIPRTLRVIGSSADGQSRRPDDRSILLLEKNSHLLTLRERNRQMQWLPDPIADRCNRTDNICLSESPAAILANSDMGLVQPVVTDKQDLSTPCSRAQSHVDH
jgi:hypothetical protein